MNQTCNRRYEGFLYDLFVLNPCNSIGGCGRPRVIYKRKNKQYVMLDDCPLPRLHSFHFDISDWTSTLLPTTALIDPHLDGLQPADFSMETVGDNGYLMFSVLNFRDPRAGSITASTAR